MLNLILRFHSFNVWVFCIKGSSINNTVIMKNVE